MLDRRQFIIAPLAVAATHALTRVAFAQQAAAPFKWVPQADLTLVDPIFTTAFITHEHAMLVFDTLYGLDADFQPHPQMAQGHTVSDDRLTWTITLRNGLLFHDGTPVTAKDAVASLKRWCQVDLLGAELLKVTANLEAVDDKSLRFTLKEPFPKLLLALAKPMTTIAAIMPERLAKDPPNTAIKEVVGSGPFRFASDKWLSGSRVVYERFEDYKPRSKDEAASFAAGPKIAYVPAVEWQIIGDAATAVAALQAGEVDGIERVQAEFVDLLKAIPDVTLQKNTLPYIPIIRFNHLYPPFNNAAIRRAVLSVVNQTEYMTAIYGSDKEIWNDRCGVFAPDTPMASDAGMDKLTGPHDFEKAKADIIAAGYKNEPVIVIDAADQPIQHTAALLTADLLKRLDMNVQVQAMDWGTAVQRRNNDAAPDAGGWNVFFTGLTGLNNLDPAGHLLLRGNGREANYGWPTSPRIEELRNAWFKADDLAEQKNICEQIQIQAFEDVPYIPLGALYPLSAFRSNWKDMQPQAPVFWTLKSA